MALVGAGGDSGGPQPRPAPTPATLTADVAGGTVTHMTITTRVRTGTRSRITSQGQITVPKVVRDAMGVGPGDELEFEPMGEGYLVRPRPRRSVLEFAGIAGRASTRIPSTADELDRLIDEGMATEAARGARPGRPPRPRR